MNILNSIKKYIHIWTIRSCLPQPAIGFNYSVGYDDWHNKTLDYRNRLSFYFGRSELILHIDLPQILKPAVVYRENRKTVTLPRRFGFMLSKDNLRINYGSYSTRNYIGVKNKHKDITLPWNVRKLTTFQILGIEYGYINTKHPLLEHKENEYATTVVNNFVEKMPKLIFSVTDYDGEKVDMSVHAERSVYQRGVGLFKWTRFFKQPEVNISLRFVFNRDMGEFKNTYKGGGRGAVVDKLDPSELVINVIHRFAANPEIYNYELRPFKINECVNSIEKHSMDLIN